MATSEEPTRTLSWPLRALFVIVCLGLWFATQWLIGSRQPTGEGIVDLPLAWTEPLTAQLHQHRSAADALLALGSGLSSNLILREAAKKWALRKPRNPEQVERKRRTSSSNRDASKSL